ncbi:hypothetical protein EV175_004178 [Coemansia sp. RSA 1933]|nr:hypothetical protein EV175_004178 [Coemansia sp. RSA 1933]
MLTSTFSHKDLIHFAFNNYALISFGTIVANEMGAEQFTAFYLTAGVISSLASQIFAPLLPALMIPSLGASGAIYGVVGAAMLMFPDIQLSFIFLSAFPTSISTLFPALMAVDFIGIICGWKAINHVSHFAEVRAKHKRPNS